MRCLATRAWVLPGAGCGDGRRPDLGRVADPLLDDGLDLRQRPLDGGTRQVVHEGREIRSLPGLETPGEQGAIGCLQAGRDRFHRTVLPSLATRAAGRFARSVR